MSDPSTLRKDRQIKYFLRCLKTLLPQAYTSNDSNRMTLAFFILAGLDLLDALIPNTTPAERQGFIDWIYHCQVPTGGFRGFTGTYFGSDNRNSENECWDPANVPATFFALVTLIVLGDDLGRVKRKECLRWLRRMQRDNGSFGEVLGNRGRIEGGSDLRFCCCAAGTRYILRGKDTNYLNDVEDINIEKLIRYIEACQSYDGGFSEAPFNESHAGLAYCAVGTLSFLDCVSPASTASSSTSLTPGTSRFEDLVHWLACRQTSVLEEEGSESDDEEEDPSSSAPAAKATQGHGNTELSLDDTIASLPDIDTPSGDLSYAGFNGRMNKIADTCYCFWVSGSLAILGRLDVIDAEANRRYLLEKTQHIIGGFGKAVGELPDVLHSYLGLVSLSLTGEPGLASVDATFCTSQRARDHLESLPWWKGS